MSSRWLKVVGAWAVVFLLVSLQVALAKKTAKEWAEFNKKKLHEIEREEQEEMKKTLGNEVPIEKPGMVFATFGPDISKPQKDNLSAKFYAQLQSAGIKVNMFETQKDQWVIATFRTFDTIDVVKYLREQPEVMKTTIDTTDHWNLPRYQKEFNKAREEKQKEEEAKQSKDEMKRREAALHAEVERLAKERKEKEALDLDAKDL